MDKDEALEAAKAVERGELPSGSVVLAVTGDNSLSHPGYPNGRCAACGFGLNPNNLCLNIECTKAETFRAALFNAPTGKRYEGTPFAHLNSVLIREDDPDPVRRNVRRGLRAGLAVRKYYRKYGDGNDNDTVLSDFLADLLHLCDMTDTDFDGALETARRRYEEEVLGE